MKEKLKIFYLWFDENQYPIYWLIFFGLLMWSHFTDRTVEYIIGSIGLLMTYILTNQMKKFGSKTIGIWLTMINKTSGEKTSKFQSKKIYWWEDENYEIFKFQKELIEEYKDENNEDNTELIEIKIIK